MTAYYDNALTEFIRQKINQAGGWISFAEFMNAALYHPTLGYYCRETMAFGHQGDFTTAPELSPLFAACFAKQCEQIFHHLEGGSILELGAGSGRFAHDILLALEKSGSLPRHYFIYEISPALRRKQAHLLETNIPQLAHQITWLDTLPAEFSGVIIANEVLDAMPVHCFRIEQEGACERGVSWEGGEFVWSSRVPDSELTEKLQTLPSLEVGYESEINLELEAWVARLSNALTQGVILFSDYGYGHLEYYSPERSRGTLTCFHEHQRHDNPLIWPGRQDMTAHVDFTRVIESAFEQGCSLGGYTTQAGFLFSCGLKELAETAAQSLTPTALFQQSQALKTLTLPTEMGERIKVMALVKQMALPLIGFQVQDRRRDL